MMQFSQKPAIFKPTLITLLFLIISCQDDDKKLTQNNRTFSDEIASKAKELMQKKIESSLATTMATLPEIGPISFEKLSSSPTEPLFLLHSEEEVELMISPPILDSSENLDPAFCSTLDFSATPPTMMDLPFNKVGNAAFCLRAVLKEEYLNPLQPQNLSLNQNPQFRLTTKISFDTTPPSSAYPLVLNVSEPNENNQRFIQIEWTELPNATGYALKSCLSQKCEQCTLVHEIAIGTNQKEILFENYDHSTICLKNTHAEDIYSWLPSQPINTAGYSSPIEEASESKSHQDQLKQADDTSNADERTNTITNLALEDLSFFEATISWQAVETTASGYYVAYSQDQNSQQEFICDSGNKGTYIEYIKGKINYRYTIKGLRAETSTRVAVCVHDKSFEQAISKLHFLDEFTTKQIPAPQNPADVQIKALTHRTAEVAFTNPSTYNNLSFRLSYAEGATPPNNCNQSSISKESTPFVLQGLSPEKTYSYIICGENHYKENNISSGVTGSFTTPGAPPPETPISVSANAPSYNTINLYWNISGDYLAGSKIAISSTGEPSDEDCKNSSIDIPYNQSTTLYSHTFKALKHSTQYYLAICAYNTNSTALHSIASQISKTTPDQPAPPNPINLSFSNQTTSQIEITWELDSQSEHAAVVAGYRIAYKEGSEAPSNCHTEQQVASSEITGTSHLITGLKHDASYSFIVCSLNGNSTPDLSSGLNGSFATSPKQAPFAPTGLLATVVSASRIDLNWSNGGGSTTDYRLAYATGNTPPSDCSAAPKISEALINGTSHQISGLSSDTTYSFIVCSINDNKTPNETPGATAAATTLQIAPPNPIHAQAMTINLNEINLQWDSGGGSTASYKISWNIGSWTPPSDCNTGDGLTTTSLTNTSISGLKPLIPYAFRICAINSNPTPDSSSGSIIQKVITQDTFKQLSAGREHTCGLTHGGKVYCWGQNFDGQLGSSSPPESNTPLYVDFSMHLDSMEGESIKEIATGASHTCALSTLSHLYCWGSNFRGQLGDLSTSYRDSPQRIHYKSIYTNHYAYKEISAGGHRTCAIASDHKVYCWGDDFGELMIGNGLNTGGICDNHDYCTSPQQVDTSNLVAGELPLEISINGTESCIRTDQGRLYCWGQQSTASIPTHIDTADPNINHFFGGSNEWVHQLTKNDNSELHTCYLGDSRQSYCFGSNAYGNLASGGGSCSPSSTTTPSIIDPHNIYMLGAMDSVGGGHMFSLTFKTIASGVNHSCAISNRGGTYCWGQNQASELGSETHNTNCNPDPRAIDRANMLPFETFTELALGNLFSCGVSNLGRLFCWGEGLYGKNGSQTNEEITIPTLVDTSNLDRNSYIKDLSVGHSFGCGLSNAGAAFCFGSYEFTGEYGDGNNTSQAHPLNLPVLVDHSNLNAGESFTQINGSNDAVCGQTNIGRTLCWGNNVFGVASFHGSTIHSPQEIDNQDMNPPGATIETYLPFSASTCGISNLGHLFCMQNFGSHSSSSYLRRVENDDFTAQKFRSIASMSRTACVLKDNGEAYCIGNNDYGQIGDGSGMEQSQLTAIDYNHSTGRIVELAAHDVESICALSAQGNIYCWGDVWHNHGLQSPTLLGSLPEVTMPEIKKEKFQHIFASGLNYYGLTDQGSLFSWGSNFNRNLLIEDGSQLSSLDQTSPTQSAPLDFATNQFPMGTSHTYSKLIPGPMGNLGVLSTDGKAYYTGTINTGTSFLFMIDISGL